MHSMRIQHEWSTEIVSSGCIFYIRYCHFRNKRLHFFHILYLLVCVPEEIESLAVEMVMDLIKNGVVAVPVEYYQPFTDCFKFFDILGHEAKEENSETHSIFRI